MLALLLLVQMAPLRIAAQELPETGVATEKEMQVQEAEVPQGAAEPAAPPATEPEVPAPVPAQLEGNTSSGTGADAEAASYTLTLELDGGQVNNLYNAGWAREDGYTYRWLRSVTESVPGGGVEIAADATLGGLLPGAPYRAGYALTGWKIGQTEYPLGSQKVQLHDASVITAQWEVTTYTVRFFDSGFTELWTVEVPYGATLWAEPDAPWTEESVDWTQDTAKVTVTLGQETYPDVLVRRHPRPQPDEGYYYTFSLDQMLYFTYGGPAPLRSGYEFTSWKMTGGSGFTVLRDTAFVAQFQAQKSYVFNIYYYYQDGTRAGSTSVVTKTQDEVKDGLLTFEVPMPEIAHYTAEPQSRAGVVWKGTQLQIEVGEVFKEPSATNFLALTVTYVPAVTAYTVEYYQQPVGVTDRAKYDLVATRQGAAAYGSRLTIESEPVLDNGRSFDGFLGNADAIDAINNGVVLEENSPNVVFDSKDHATIRIYYDRASYFIYIQTGTTEVQLSPLKIQYGSQIPGLDTYLDQLTRTGYQPVTADDISWYRLDADGELVQVQPLDPEDPDYGKMPAYDLYLVISWRPAETSIRLVYWVESKNSDSFQNAYTTTVEHVPTEALLTVYLENGMPEISGVDNGQWVVEDGFETMITSYYKSAAYTTFFSYSPQDTKESPGNVQSAQQTNSGEVENGAITADRFQVKVSGDGSTTINLYFLRNMYTLEFVLARKTALGSTQVAISTPGTFDGSSWITAVSPVSFLDFTNPKIQIEPGGEIYGGLNVQKKYRLQSTDARSPVGRYGTKTVRGYTCQVYTLSAKFEADITALWPLSGNTSGGNPYKYISMGTDAGSYYRNVFATTTQKNILNAYATMNQTVLAMGDAYWWTAVPDNGDGAVAHQMIAYWSGSAVPYDYYFLFQTLDTTLTSQSADVQAFDPDLADWGEYERPGGLGRIRGWAAGILERKSLYL